MTISIIIPVYNVENYLSQCLDSIINQSYKDFEIILVNDGSTDSSQKICNDYEKSDSRIKLINKKNGGLSDARNAGLQLATGDYIWFVDSDDWITDEALAILSDCIKSQNCELIAFSYIDFFENTNSFSEVRNLQEILNTDGNSYIKESVFFFTGACSYIYKKEFLDYNCLVFKINQLHEDDYFNLSCFGKVKSIIKIPHGLYFYRQRENTITSSISIGILNQRVLSYIELIKLCREIKDIDSEFLYKKTIAYQRNMYYIIRKITLLNNVSFYEKYCLINKTKKYVSIKKIKNNIFKHSKKEWLEKSLFNLSTILYILFLSILEKLSFKCY